MKTEFINHEVVPGSRKTASETAMKGIVRDALEKVFKDDGILSEDETVRQCKVLSDTIKDDLKTMEWERYKYVVQVMLGEQMGQGVNVGSRCLWNEEMDVMASETYIRVSNMKMPPPEHNIVPDP